jgi:hypothetical protein
VIEIALRQRLVGRQQFNRLDQKLIQFFAQNLDFSRR